MCDTTVTQSNDTVVPAPVRTNLDLTPGDKLEWHKIEGEWILRKQEDN
ncbi:AbrB/MazE/SpoVT family DNA-binding domain-containing protein [Haladaptatus cibarius]|nr:AbrB/MazE/SpoVT family DNA-binding domain-containing protein [Haladaptatus cibarius]